DEELARLLAAEDVVQGLTDEDAVPDLPQVLSLPRAICGSSVVIECFAAMQQHRATSSACWPAMRPTSCSPTRLQRRLRGLHRGPAEDPRRPDESGAVPQPLTRFGL